MKLLLTSSGFEDNKIKNFFAKEISQKGDKTVALITLLKTREELSQLEITKEIVESLGMKAEIIDINKSAVHTFYPEFDVYIVCDGNAFHLLDRLRALGLENKLIEEANKGKFYVGIGSGSVLAGPDLESARILGYINNIGLHNKKCFHFTPFLVVPHYSNKIKKDVVDFKKYRFQEAVIALTDSQALFINDYENVLIGEWGGLQFCENVKLKNRTE